MTKGVHLEGPFISREKRGAHDDSLIVPSLARGMDDVMCIYGSLDNAAVVTLAPELPGAIDVIRQLTSLGITVSLGDVAPPTGIRPKMYFTISAENEISAENGILLSAETETKTNISHHFRPKTKPQVNKQLKQ